MFVPYAVSNVSRNVMDGSAQGLERWVWGILEFQRGFGARGTAELLLRSLNCVAVQRRTRYQILARLVKFEGGTDWKGSKWTELQNCAEWEVGKTFSITWNNSETNSPQQFWIHHNLFSAQWIIDKQLSKVVVYSKLSWWVSSLKLIKHLRVLRIFVCGIHFVIYVYLHPLDE